MGNKLDPEPLTPLENPEAEAQAPNSPTLGSYTGTVRRFAKEPLKERIEPEEIIRSLTERDQSLAVISFRRLVTWQLTFLATFALLILLLYGLGVVKLPTALVFAVVAPLLSGVLGLLGLLIKPMTE